MRLICTVTGHFIQINEPSDLVYAILSHTWAPEGEQTFQELRIIQEKFGLSEVLNDSNINDVPFPSEPKPGIYVTSSADQHTSPASLLSTSAASEDAHSPNIWDDPTLSEKVKRASAVARAAGYRFLWIDSCCIDKTSSAELSEAINSMYAWYRDATVCFAYLPDVPDGDDPHSELSAFHRSRWFKRGWTLQELIAPLAVVFLSESWSFFGTKSGLADAVARATNIEDTILTHKKALDEVSVAARMSWASGRQTTRVEDRAYSLLGIFSINLPTVYGEGTRAFLRLQEEILKRIPDQSIFAWGHVDFDPLPPPYHYSAAPDNDNDHSNALPTVALVGDPKGIPILAQSPSLYSDVSTIRPVSYTQFSRLLRIRDLPYPTYTPTPFGLHTQFPVVPIRHGLSRSLRLPPRSPTDNVQVTRFLAILACGPSEDGEPEHLFAMVCTPANDPDHINIHNVSVTRSGGDSSAERIITVRLILLSRQNLVECSAYLTMMTAYTRMEDIPLLGPLNTLEHERSTLALSKWNVDALKMLGYRAQFSLHHPLGGRTLVISSDADGTIAFVVFSLAPPHVSVLIQITSPLTIVDHEKKRSKESSSKPSSFTLDLQKATNTFDFGVRYPSGREMTIRITVLAGRYSYIDIVNHQSSAGKGQGNDHDSTEGRLGRQGAIASQVITGGCSTAETPS